MRRMQQIFGQDVRVRQAAEKLETALKVADSFLGYRIRTDIRRQQVRAVEIAEKELDEAVYLASAAQLDPIPDRLRDLVENSVHRVIRESIGRRARLDLQASAGQGSLEQNERRAA